jgi:hypothetical protein
MSIERRVFLQTALAVAGAVLLAGHSPYRQWYAFRAKHWLIVAAHGDPQASRLADAVSERLAAQVPESQAMAAEAETERDVVQLLRSRQLELGILTVDAANDAWSGSGTARRDGPVPLRTLTAFGPHLLVALDDYSSDRTMQIVAALAGLRWQDDPLPTPRPAHESHVPLHSGAARYQQAAEPQLGR